MGDWTIYRAADLALVGMTLHVDRAELDAFLARHPAWAAIEGAPPRGCGYVKSAGDGVEFDAARRPPAPNEHHTWDEASASWVDLGARELAQRQAAIAGIEAGTMRALREHALGMPGSAARLQAIDDGIKQQRDAMAALRTQRAAKRGTNDKG